MALNKPNKRIVEFHIARLQDKNPEVRLKAINELALLPDGDGLVALQAIFEKEEDPNVKKAAQEAGRKVFLLLKQQGSEATGSGS
ncbi:MAG: HEAT repeat domain-containing protein [Anaerolineaceae bacterium]|nr:HEAT repeat domain-containing protein [Anaerolineaceae bacterium]